MRKLCIAATVLVPATALAGGNLIPTQNPRDLALSQSTVASQTGAEAVVLNVAALAGQEGLDISASGQLINNRTDWAEGNQDASLLAKNSFPPALAASYGDRLANGMGWGVGAGLSVPAGGTIIWPNGWPGQERIQSVEQEVFQITAGAAIQPTPYLKLGASYIHYRQVQELHQSINYLDHYGDAGLSLAGDGNTFAVAAEFKVPVPNVPLTIAVTYKHSADIKLKGDAHFEAVPAQFQALIHDQEVTEDITVPNEFYIGAAYEVIPDLKVTASYNLERWTVWKHDLFVGSDGFMVEVPRDYKNAYVLRIGGEWAKPAFLPALTLRVGAQRSMSDQPTDTVSPTLTDGNSTAFSLGGGFNILKDLRVDAGFQHIFFDKVTATGEEAFAGNYKTWVDVVSVGVNWRMDLAH